MRIDAQHGTVRLPNGFVIAPDLTPGLLLAAPVAAKAYNHSALPFSWFSAQGGPINGTSLLAEFCFWENLLVHADLHLDTERIGRAKVWQERLLAQGLGVPHLIQEDASHNDSALLNALSVYRFPWGEITSLHSGNKTFIRIEFAGRRRAAMIAFTRASIRENLVTIQQFKQRRFEG